MMKDRTATHITSHIVIKDKTTGKVIVSKSLNKPPSKHQKVTVNLEKKHE
jgi:hypothetical protein